ncbi:MAG: hypothetical protein ABIR91_00325 [Candidatus Saccharimonadales bacterium]
MKKLLVTIGVVAVLAGLGTTLSAVSGTYTTPNCGESAVVKCGTNNQSQLNAGLSTDVKAVYAKYNIDTDLSKAKTGLLKSNGDVVVSGKVIATGAQSVGRNAKAGTTTVTINGKKYHIHSAKAAFIGYDTPIFVFYNKDGSFKSAIAKVCGNPIIAKPVPVPAYNCDSLAVTKVSRTSFKFATKYSVKNATYKSTTYVVKDASGKQVYKGSTATYNQTKAGTYTVEATITVVADGKTKTDTSAACKKSFTVTPEVKTIKVCDLSTYKIVTINEKDFDTKKYSKDVKNCCPPKTIKVCDLTTKKIVTINEKDFNNKKHSKNLDDCKEVVKKIQVCNLSTKMIITINEKDFDSKKHSKNLKDCIIYKDIKVCELATKKIITIKENTFDSKKHSKNLDDCKEVVKNIKVCELATKKIVTIDEKKFDAKKHSKNLDDCKVIVKNIEVCELATKKLITIDEKNFDSAKHSKNLDDCKEVVKTIKVCELATKTIVTINEKDFDETKYSKDVKDCDEEEVVKIEVCDLNTKEIVTIDKKDYDETKYSTDTTKCDVTPVTPPELPTTGPTEMVASGLGVGAIIAAASYYVASRRSLLSALLGK